MSDLSINGSDITRFSGIDWNNLGFGRYFSDHIYISNYKNGEWDKGVILPYGPLLIEPGMCTLHYGQTIFEGLKAYYDVRGGANIFRPDRNAARLNKSAVRLCIPEFDPAQFIDGIVKLVKIDKQFIPNKRGQSLYLRPVMFGSSNFLGVQASDDYMLIVMTSPVASYYPEGLNPIKILVMDKYVRAVKGGLGQAKTAANYAASLYGGKVAKSQGFSQVLWLDGVEHKYIDEVGAMNIFFIIDDELITPSLEQESILAGVTRETVIHLAREWGMKVTERPIAISEVFEAHKSGKLQEAFGTGTAAIISPVGLFKYNDSEIVLNDMKIGEVAQKLYDTITGIQHGEVEDKYGWNVHVDL
jgi:branched-chain amino acid aminotransferase